MTALLLVGSPSITMTVLGWYTLPQVSKRYTIRMNLNDSRWLTPYYACYVGVLMTPLYRCGKLNYHGFTKRHLYADNLSNLYPTFRSGTTRFHLRFLDMNPQTVDTFTVIGT
ncbi:hypothetical protein BDF21DRAFT_472152 [Thamnidium elegans]|nr:hypothetical protein BDF21DRAFT_472152 [Thamnidium elegans]